MCVFVCVCSAFGWHLLIFPRMFFCWLLLVVFSPVRYLLSYLLIPLTPQPLLLLSLAYCWYLFNTTLVTFTCVLCVIRAFGQPLKANGPSDRPTVTKREIKLDTASMQHCHTLLSKTMLLYCMLHVLVCVAQRDKNVLNLNILYWQQLRLQIPVHFVAFAVNVSCQLSTSSMVLCN